MSPPLPGTTAAAPRSAGRGGLKVGSGWELAGLALIGLAAVALRLPGLGDRSLWIDEIATGRSVSQPSLTALLSSLDYNQSPLPYLIGWPLHWLGGGEALLRAPAVVEGILLVPATFWLARSLFGSTA